MNNHYFPRGNADTRDNHEPIATTKWASKSQIVKAFSEDEGGVNPFIFGKVTDEEGAEKLLTYCDDAGIATIAKARSGKGVSLIVPNLLSYEGPVIVLDLKGENASITANHRARQFGQKMAVFDPYGETDFPTSSLNLLSFYDSKNPEFIDDITELSEAMIVRGNENDPHWNDSARSVLKMVLMYVIIYEKNDKKKNLVEMRRLILKGQSKSQMIGYKLPEFKPVPDWSAEENEELKKEIEKEIRNDQKPSFYQFLKNLAEYENDYIAGTAQRLLQAGDRERGSIISSAQRHCEFIDSPRIHRVLKRNDFDLNDLRKSSVYLVLPERRLDSQSRWRRMMITVMLKQLQTDKKKDLNEHSMLVVLDEAASLGNMPLIENAVAYAPGFGVKIWTIWQSLSQMKKSFGDGYETILGNAGVLTVFGNTDLATTEYISKRLGKCETPRLEENYSGSSSRNQNQVGFEHMTKSAVAMIDGGGSTSESESYNIRPNDVISPLLLPEEVARYFGKDTNKILVLFGQGFPVCANRIKYFEDEPFKFNAEKSNFFS